MTGAPRQAPCGCPGNGVCRVISEDCAVFHSILPSQTPPDRSPPNSIVFAVNRIRWASNEYRWSLNCIESSPNRISRLRNASRPLRIAWSRLRIAISGSELHCLGFESHEFGFEDHQLLIEIHHFDNASDGTDTDSGPMAVEFDHLRFETHRPGGELYHSTMNCIKPILKRLTMTLKRLASTVRRQISSLREMVARTNRWIPKLLKSEWWEYTTRGTISPHKIL